MEQEIHITLRFNLAIGKIGLNEIVYKLKEVRDSLMLKILQQVLTSYDDLISERLSRTDIYPSKDRKGLGRHVRKGDSEGRFCRGRKILKRGYRSKSRQISTVFGKLDLPLISLLAAFIILLLAVILTRHFGNRFQQRIYLVLWLMAQVLNNKRAVRESSETLSALLKPAE
jgi:hypothetical protein